MKRLIIFTLVLIARQMNAQGSEGDTLRNTGYGIELNQFITGSGYSSATELLFSVREGRRNFNIGFFFCSDARRITGIIAHHEVALTNAHNHNPVRPYIFYNCIARISKIENTGSDKSDPGVTGIYKTFEHHLGIGLRAHITRNIYFSGSAGYGVYFGSVKKPEYVKGSNELIGSNGFAPIAKVGFGLILN